MCLCDNSSSSSSTRWWPNKDTNESGVNRVDTSSQTEKRRGKGRAFLYVLSRAVNKSSSVHPLKRRKGPAWLSVGLSVREERWFLCAYVIITQQPTTRVVGQVGIETHSTFSVTPFSGRRRKQSASFFSQLCRQNGPLWERQSSRAFFFGLKTSF